MAKKKPKPPEYSGVIPLGPAEKANRRTLEVMKPKIDRRKKK